ncbi:MAG: MoaD/ThiS family protein [Rhodocyclaceae bacterium]|nr:MoaD/ThiS family protein [Rhodocyclaceae bacterium]MBX3670616.1 MoaD/ThiS family protein [Rhodocyclaceae bacterium]
MNVTLKLYATLADYLPDSARSTNSLALSVTDGVTPAALIEAHRLPQKLCHLVLVNGVFVPPGERASKTLVEGDVLAIWPPIAGG